MQRRLLILISAAVIIPAEARVVPAHKNVLIEGVPHMQQKPDFCGEACVVMYMRKLGKDVTQDDVFNASDLDPSLGRGCYTKDLVAALKKIGFKPGKVWHRVRIEKADKELESIWQAIYMDLRKGVPTIVCTRYDDTPGSPEHFRLLLGYDAGSSEMIYHEPAEPDGAYRRMHRDHFLKILPLKYDPKRWTVIRIPLRHGRLRLPKPTTGHTSAGFAQHIRKVKERISTRRFTIVVEPPFVVIGDEPEAIVRRRSKETVRGAVDLLKKAYFKYDPYDIIDIWLFKDETSYRTHTYKLFRDRPTTPFGYYSEEHRALIMDIDTGGGTLVHEIVHPFMASNFPKCPAWFNEGLGSLYEQCSYKGDKIRGLTNWRLSGLQQAIRDNALPLFESLCGTTQHEFYDADPGTNYAQARYLCYYLQEKNLLRKFYHAFVNAHADDPGGYKTLQRILQKEDMAAFQKKWQTWILKLRLP